MGLKGRGFLESDLHDQSSHRHLHRHLFISLIYLQRFSVIAP